MNFHPVLRAACFATLLALTAGAHAQGFGSISSATPDTANVAAQEPPLAQGPPAAAAPVASDAPAAFPTAPAFSSAPPVAPVAPDASAGAATPTTVAPAPAPASAAATPTASASSPAFATTPATTPAASPEPTPSPTPVPAAPAVATNESPEITIPFGSSGPPSEVPAPKPLVSADKVLVRKSERRLYLMRANQIIAEYPIRLGLNPTGDKEREGDFRTPEGEYELVRRNPRSRFFMALEVSYPNPDDIARAKKAGVKPGGLIMIHGQPNVPRKSPEYYQNYDWTDGCIAVSNSDMVDIWLRTGIGTPIVILP